MSLHSYPLLRMKLTPTHTLKMRALTTVGVPTTPYMKDFLSAPDKTTAQNKLGVSMLSDANQAVVSSLAGLSGSGILQQTAAGAYATRTTSYILDLVGGVVQGDILYRDSSGWAKLAAGTSGEVLQTQGTGANPAWAPQAGAGEVSILQFIPVALHANIRACTDSTDLATYLATAKTYIAGITNPPALIFPSGKYTFSSFPNFAITNARIIGVGEVLLDYTGSGDAVYLDGGSSTFVWNMEFVGFSIRAGSGAANGFHVRSVHHSRFRVSVLGCGTASAAIFLEFCVCSHLDRPVVSNNEHGGYGSAVPLYGIMIDRRGSGGDYCSYCLITNPVIEGVGYGFYFSHALGNTIVGGTSEGCAHYGAYFDTASDENKFIGTDFEVNTTGDIFAAGTRNRVLDCDTTNVIYIASGASRFEAIGGAHSQITAVAGANDTIIERVVYNRLNNGSTLSDSGTRTTIRDAQDFNTGSLLQYTIGSQNISGDLIWAGAAASTWTPTVTASTPGGTPPTFTVNSARYKKFGKYVFLSAKITITAAGTGSGDLIFTLPVTASALTEIFSGLDGGTGKSIRGYMNDSTHVYIRDYNNITVIATGSVVYINGTYETT